MYNKNICSTKFIGITMKKFFALLLVVIIAITSVYAENKAGDNQLQRKSNLAEPPTFGPAATSFPAPFSELTQPRTQATISTGYFWVDTDEYIDPKFRNADGTSKWDILQSYVDTNTEPGLWTRVLPGPRILPKEHWDEYKNDGLPFFRNTANVYNQLVNFWDHSVVGDGALDSTDDAIAGPMPLSIAGGFYFNGVRFDSFYVSTNGVIALTNRRYFYDESGNRIVPTGSLTAYDPMSMDWFVTVTDPNAGCTRCRTWADIGGGYGTGDLVRDDFGYMHSVMGLEPNKVTEAPPTTGPSRLLDGIRARGVSFTGLKANLKQALIAFSWGDMELSQWNPVKKQVDGYGKVYFKRSIQSDKMIISVFNMAIVRGVNLAYGGNQNFPLGKRLYQDEDIAQMSAQIVLNGKDSSITILYRDIPSILTFAFWPDYAYQAFRRNSICGVSGWARHINYPAGAPAPDPNSTTNFPPTSTTPEYFYPWGSTFVNGEYQQFTVYYDKYRLSGIADVDYKVPGTFSKVKFKQWKNTLRAPDVQYYVRETKDLSVPIEKFPNKISSANNYELFAGIPRIGAVQPVALVQNLTNDVQGPNGVNFTNQELNFRVRFRIENQVTQKIIYNRIMPISQGCLSATASGDALLIYEQCKDPQGKAWLCQTVTKSGSVYTATPLTNFDGTGYKGIPSYKFAQVYFAPFEPNEFIPSNIGRLRAYVTAEPYTPEGESLGDAWPFDDETSLNLFVMRRMPAFNDDVTEFHQVYGITMPSVWKWVNLEAEAVNGETVSENPLPPRGRFNASYEAKYDEIGNITNKTYASASLESPSIKMNRILLDGRPWSPGVLTGRAGNGDEIRSFPIDMRGKYNSILSVSVQRTQKQEDWPRGWSDQTMVGPEPRVIINSAWNAPYTNTNAVSQTPDELAVEILKPSDDGLNGITNPLDADWSIHPRRFGMAPVGVGSLPKNPAITVLGAGGYRVGFLETDKDSTLTLEDLGGLKPNGLRPNLFDDGIDHEFKKYFVTIPDTFIRWKNEGAYNFRFRIKVLSNDDTKGCNPFSPLVDDADDWIIDNVNITIPKEVPDIEVSAINLIWPYTITPASQATSIPINVSLSNNSSRNAPNMSIKVKIYRADDFWEKEQDPIYCRTENISNLNGGKQIEVSMPAWNARKTQADTLSNYIIESMVIMAEKDLNTINDTNFTKVSLRFGDVYAYDPALNKPKSNVDNFTGLPGRGLNFAASNYAGGAGWPAWNAISDAAGVTGGDMSGQFAIRFDILNIDTLRGFQTFFTGLSQSPEPIQVGIYKDRGGLPDEVIGLYATTRMYGNLLGFEKYVTLQLNNPVEVQPGTYWVTIAQLGEYGLNLGGSASRMGMRTMNTSVAPNGLYGLDGTSLVLDKNFRIKNVIGQKVNNNYFVYENVRFTGNWVKFTPPNGNPAYPHYYHYGSDPVDNCTQTLQQGSWIPMHRPYFGFRSFGEDADKYQWCSDDLPVRLNFFDYTIRQAGVDLLWETSVEENNFGFYVEKREGTSSDVAFQSIGFKEGKGNSSVATRYSFLDENVVPNTTYQYRLRQVDKDGTQACETSDVVTVTFGTEAALVLEPNSPNPFKGATTLSFTLPNRTFATLEVLDIYGNVVKTLVNNELNGASHKYVWDGTNQSNQFVTSGTYIYRLTAGKDILTGKMTLVR